MVEVIQSFRCSLCGQEFKPYPRGNKTALKEAKEDAQRCESSHATHMDMFVTPDFCFDHNINSEVDHNDVDLGPDEVSHLPSEIYIGSRRYKE